MASDARIETIGGALKGVLRDKTWLRNSAIAMLVNAIPYLGAVWVMGYTLHYQRALAWGTDDRLPAWRPIEPHLRTGLYAYVAGLAYALVPSILLGAGMSVAIMVPEFTGADMAGDGYFALIGVLSMVMVLVGLLFSAALFPVYVHVNLNDRIDAGFQVKRIYGLVRENAELFWTTARRTYGLMLLSFTATMLVIVGVIAAGAGLSVLLLPTGMDPVVYILLVVPAELLAFALAVLVAMPMNFATYRLWAGYARVAYGIGPQSSEAAAETAS